MTYDELIDDINSFLLELAETLKTEFPTDDINAAMVRIMADVITVRGKQGPVAGPAALRDLRSSVRDELESTVEDSLVGRVLRRILLEIEKRYKTDLEETKTTSY
ncbi:MAG: hypothetical protein OXP69_06440 [Spirochaetaceae bacterium]|nr:hypothetical protein [Spirochaetaceae bacterium]